MDGKISEPTHRLRIEKAQPVHEQIRRQLRALIIAGEFAEGARLPPTRELARLWGTQPSLVQKALEPLAREGWLRRAQRAGTFVRRAGVRLERAGIYYPGAGYAHGDVPYISSLHRAIERKLMSLGMTLTVLTDPRPPAAQGKVWPGLTRALRERGIQVLLATLADWTHQAWLRKLPVPVALATMDGGVVNYDMPQMADLALAALRRQGCRSAGLIVVCSPEMKNADGSPHILARFEEQFLRRAARQGMSIRPEWVWCKPNTDPLPVNQHSAFGYDGMAAIWGSATRPDGLFVWPDSAANGVIMAIMQRRIRVPGELKLVIHRNAGTPIFCPLPATFIDLREDEVADALATQMNALWLGGTVDPLYVGFHVAGSAGRVSRGRPAGRRGAGGAGAERADGGGG